MPAPLSPPSVSDPLPRRASSAALLRLCLLGVAGGSAVAAGGGADPVLPSPNEIPRCVSQPPRSGFHLTKPVLYRPETSGPLADLAISVSGTAWLVGEDGEIRHRAAPGGAWERQESGTAQDLSALHVDAQGSVWAVGAGGTLLRLEGGTTSATGWRPVSAPGRADLREVWFWDGQVGWVASAAGDLYRTTDGGARWQRLGRATEAESPIVALAASPEGPQATVFALREDGMVLIASPEGGTPRAAAIPGSVLPLRDGMAWSGSVAVVLDAVGTAWSTQDGGQTWRGSSGGGGGDPLRALVRTPLGEVAVRESGRLASVQQTAEGVQIVPLAPQAHPFMGEGMPAVVPEPPPGVVVTRAVTAPNPSGGLMALSADGQILEQLLQPWFEPGHPCGRPFEVARQARHAPTTAPLAGSGWAPPREPPPADLSLEERRALAAAWREDALAEHASVASFARFSLRLLALGAPAALLADAQQAMGDEIRHAQRCFALASRYAGVPLAPGPLSIAGALDGDSDLLAVSIEVLREGAVGETIGALLAAEMRDRAQDPQVRAALTEIADDEARHAQMAWRFLRWAVDQGGASLRQHLQIALQDALRDAEPSATTASASASVGAIAAEVWAGHGRLLPREARRIQRRALREIIRPCAAALLDS